MQRRIGLPGWCFGIAAVAALAGAAFTWSPIEPPSRRLQAEMTGQFVLDEPRQTVERRLGEAVERVVRPLGARIRSIARSQLSQVLHYCRGYELALDRESFRVRCDEEPAQMQRIDGLAAGFAAPAGLRVQLSDDAVQLTPGQGGVRTTYRFDPEGRLEVSVRVTSEQLARPMDWSVRYRRISPVETVPAPVSIAER